MINELMDEMKWDNYRSDFLAALGKSVESL